MSRGGNGVIHMGLLNIIRRMHLREKLSIREIARRTGLSRNTVTRHLSVDTVEPRFATPERASKLDPFAEKLTGWLKTEAGKSRKQRRTLKHLHADLVALGFTGSYGRVAAFARQWRANRQREQQTTGRGTFVPLSFRPGEAFQFDWSEDFAVLGGERTKLQMAHTHCRASAEHQPKMMDDLINARSSLGIRRKHRTKALGENLPFAQDRITAETPH